jgi:hypothetical protein
LGGKDSREEWTFRAARENRPDSGGSSSRSGGTGGVASSGRSSGDETASEWKDSVGQLMRVNSDLAVFERDRRVYTHRFGDSGLSEVSNRQA